MDEIRISVREISILRLIYESGMISLELMDNLFRKKKITKEELKRRINTKNEEEKTEKKREEKETRKTNTKEDKEGEGDGSEKQMTELLADKVLLEKAERIYKVYSVNKMREAIKDLLRKGYLVEYRSLIEDKFRIITLGKKGYDLINKGYRTKDILETENSKRERTVLLRNMDSENFYRHFRIYNINVNEYDHHDYILRLKIALQLFIGKPVIMHDYLKDDSQLFRNGDRCDLLVRVADKEYVAVEYERSLKTGIRYLGNKYESNGRMINVPGFFKARQDPVFLPNGNKLRAVIIVCENENIVFKLTQYLNALATPKMKGPDAGKYLVLDKFFFIDKSKFEKISQMLKEGQLLNFRKQKIGDKVDYIQSTFTALLSAN